MFPVAMSKSKPIAKGLLHALQPRQPSANSAQGNLTSDLSPKLHRIRTMAELDDEAGVFAGTMLSQSACSRGSERETGGLSLCKVAFCRARVASSELLAITLHEAALHVLNPQSDP